MSNIYDDESNCYMNLQTIGNDDVRQGGTMTPTSGDVSTEHACVEPNAKIGQIELPKRTSSRSARNSPREKLFRCACISCTITVVCLVAWNIYLTLMIHAIGPESQVHINETTTFMLSASTGKDYASRGHWSGDNETTTTRLSTSTDKDPISLECPVEWIRYETSCYLFIFSGFSFVKAMEQCMGHGAYLVHVETHDENTFLRNTCESFKPARFWVGLTDQVKEGVWILHGTNTVTNYTDWAKGEPNGGARVNCAIFWDYQNYHWADEACGLSHQVICEKPIVVFK